MGEIENYILANVNPAIGNKADIFSPTFTGDPKAPTPATADNDTSIATTAFVKAQNYLVPGGLSNYSDIAARAPGAIASGQMQGLGITYTPVKSTKLIICLTGTVTASTGQVVTLFLRSGTGTAPAKGAAATGTIINQFQLWNNNAADIQFPISLTALWGGSVGVQLWFDISLTISTSTSQVLGVNTWILEI